MTTQFDSNEQMFLIIKHKVDFLDREGGKRLLNA